MHADKENNNLTEENENNQLRFRTIRLNYPNEGVRIINIYIYSCTVINLYVGVTEVWESWLELLMKYSSRLLMYSLYEILCTKCIIVINVSLNAVSFSFIIRREKFYEFCKITRLGGPHLNSAYYILLGSLTLLVVLTYI